MGLIGRCRGAWRVAAGRRWRKRGAALHLFEVVEDYEGCSDDDRCAIELGVIRAWFKEGEMLRLEIAELRRTRAEAEAAARAQGVREGHALAKAVVVVEACQHESWSFEKDGRRCLKCGALLADLGD
jgi:hypothetical protein